MQNQKKASQLLQLRDIIKDLEEELVLVKEDLEVKELQLEDTAKQKADAELSFLESIRDLKRQSELQQDSIKALEGQNCSLEKEVRWI